MNPQDNDGTGPLSATAESSSGRASIAWDASPPPPVVARFVIERPDDPTTVE